MKTALKIVGPIILIALLVPVIFYVGLKLWGDWHDEWSGYNASNYIGDGYCNIAVVPILGEVHSYGVMYDEFGNEIVSTNMNDTLNLLGQAEMEPGIYGVLALIDSPGGSAAAAQLIATELQNSLMPNAAYIVDSGTSAAYLIASGADTIIASPFSDVGSIGVTMSYLDYSRQNQEQGIDYVPLISAKFKDYGSPDKPLTTEERELLERDLAIWHDEFVNQVAANRELPVEAVAKLADGSSLPGKLALENKLVDQLGDKETVRAWFADQLELPLEEVIFCR
ncbi:MAG: S49 family peptidase [Candidatus Pacebacteria bacterium]|jgi:protease-4|nr:S49 family peptidase [Candidatus Paceibacterota bacterium]